MDTDCGKRSEAMRERTCQWTEKFYDWTPEQIEQYFESQGDSFNHIIYIEYSYQQLGLSDDWFKKMASGMEPMDIRRDLLLQRMHGSSLSPYPREDIEYIVQVAHKPIENLTLWINEFFRFDVYKPLDKRKAYLIGVDCSTGTLGDNNAITILDPVTVEPVAEFKNAYIGETKFEKLLISLIMDYFPRSVLCIERNSVGDGIIDHLLYSPIAGNLYYDKQKDLMEETMHDHQTTESLLKKEAGMKRYYGVYTERNSRDTMFKILARHINEYKEKFITQNITSDISKLVRTASGKIAAASGEHDDSVMSYLITLYVYYHGNNLETFGIYRGATEESLNNQGLKQPEEIDSKYVPQELIDAAIRDKQKEAEMNQYYASYKAALEKAQKETYELQKKGLISGTVFENSPDDAYDVYEDNDSTFNSVFSAFNNLN